MGALSAQQHFKSSSDDIFLSTYIKSGTTWIRALAFAVVNGRKFSIHDDHPLLNTHLQEQGIATYLEGAFGFPQVPDVDSADIPSRTRIFASHLPYSLLPDSVRDVGHVVCVRHDPKDVLVSMRHFANTIKLSDVNITLDEVFDDFCDGCSAFGPIWDHQMEYKKASIDFLKYRTSPSKIFYLTCR